MKKNVGSFKIDKTRLTEKTTKPRMKTLLTKETEGIIREWLKKTHTNIYKTETDAQT